MWISIYCHRIILAWSERNCTHHCLENNCVHVEAVQALTASIPRSRNLFTKTSMFCQNVHLLWGGSSNCREYGTAFGMQSDTSQLQTPFFVQVSTANIGICASWYVWNARSGAKPCVFTAGPLYQKDQNSDVWKLIHFPQVKNHVFILVNFLHMLWRSN